MAVFTNKPLAKDELTFIRNSNIMLEHWDDELGALQLDVYSYSCPHENRRFDTEEWDDRKLVFTFKDRSSFKQAYQMARSIIKAKENEEEEGQQIDVTLPDEVTKDTSEDQIEHAMLCLTNYTGRPLTSDNADELQAELRLLAGCAIATADALNALQTKTH